MRRYGCRGRNEVRGWEGVGVGGSGSWKDEEAIERDGVVGRSESGKGVTRRKEGMI